MYKLVLGVALTSFLSGCTAPIKPDEPAKLSGDILGFSEGTDKLNYIITDEPYVDPTPIYDIPKIDSETVAVTMLLPHENVEETVAYQYEFTLKSGLLKQQINALLKKYFKEYAPYWEEGVDFNAEWFGDYTIKADDRWVLLNQLLDSYQLSLKVKKNDVLHFNKVSK